MKNHPGIFSAWNVVGHAVEKEIRNEPPASIASSELVAVVTVGICPGALLESVKDEAVRELSRRFSMLYTRRPDLVLRLLGTIRETWTDASAAAKTRRHVLSTAWTGGVVTSAAKQVAIQAELGCSRDDVRKAILPSRLKTPSFRPRITKELSAALWELSRRGFDVGLGFPKGTKPR